jgi:uncharacterized membrane protein YphA (DoxX/SURF4 family)
LRTAIGWHFLTEGLHKLDPEDGKPFNSEGYLRAAQGPFASAFRSIIPDVDAREILSRDQAGRPEGLKRQWRDELDRLIAHYRLDPGQIESAEAALNAAAQRADDWFLDRDNAEKIAKYFHELDRVRSVESDPSALAYQRELAQKTAREVETTRRELVGILNGWTESLRKDWAAAGIPTEAQKASYGEYQPPPTLLDLSNQITKWGLTLVGIGLLLGLLTPVAALAGAGFLTLFYLAQPPWPGLPVPPQAEGHYWIVNKNLIELLACLVLAATPNGLWIGLDAWLFGGLGRRRRDAGPRVPFSDPPGSNPALLPTADRPRGSSDPRQPIPLSTSGSPR